MRSKWKFIQWVFGISLFGWIISSPIFAQAAPQQTTQVAISLVIDNSGSMKESDPDNLRKTASEILVELLSPEDEIGVIQFSDNATEVFSLQPVGTNKQELKQSLAGSFTNSGATDYLKALQMAAKQLEEAPADSDKLILFLTDGLPEQQVIGTKTPLTKEEYSKKLKDQVSEIGEKGILIYPIGFGNDEGDLNFALLDEMALATKGESFVLTDPKQIASSFFDTLTLTKNRNPIEELNGLTLQDKNITVPMDNYTQQVTVLITSDGSELTVEHDGGNKEDVVLLNSASYSILTVNKKNPGANNEVTLKVKTNGTAHVSAARDLFFKMTVLQPESNVMKSLSEPFSIETTLSQPLEKGMVVEATVFKNGVPDHESIILEEQTKTNYSALYEQVDILGDYQVVISVKKDAEVIAETSSSFSVKNIPTLKSDMKLDGEQFQIGESITLTSYLQLQNLRVEGNPNLQVEHYQFYLQKEENNNRVYSMADNAADGTGDILSGDGLYTGRIPFDEKGIFNAFVRVKGKYKEESFIQQLNLGTVTVVDSGTMEVALLDETATKNRKGMVDVPVRITNHSEKKEIILVSLPDEAGTIKKEKIVLEARGTLEETVRLQLKDSEAETVALSFNTENKQVLVLEGPQRLVYLVSEKTLLERSSVLFQNNQRAIYGMLGLLLLVYIIGRVLYQILVHRRLIDWQEINYYAITKGPESRETILPPPGKNHLRITIGQTEERATLNLPGQIAFALEFMKQLDKKEGPKFIEGYKATFQKNTFVMKVQAQAPGYLKYNGQIVTQLIVEQETSFEADGYRFSFQLEPSETTARKNLLEGKEG